MEAIKPEASALRSAKGILERQPNVYRVACSVPTVVIPLKPKEPILICVRNFNGGEYGGTFQYHRGCSSNSLKPSVIYPLLLMWQFVRLFWTMHAINAWYRNELGKAKTGSITAQHFIANGMEIATKVGCCASVIHSYGRRQVEHAFRPMKKRWYRRAVPCFGN